MPYPTATAAAMPTTAPRAASPVSVDAWNVASRNTEVSKPSLSTARNAIPASAHAVPRPSASVALASSSFVRCRACVRIQTIMPVTKTTATMPMTASMPSCCAWGRACSTTCRPKPTAMLRTTGDADAEPHRGEGDTVAAQERGDDADDERGFEAFTETDDEGGEHDEGKASLTSTLASTSSAWGLMVLMNLLSADGLAAVTNVLDLAGVFASALLGGAVARSMDFDLFGFLVVGFVSGLGGGMLRDVLLQNGPPVALTDPLYVPVAVAGALVAFLVSFSERGWDRLFTFLDAAVIGFWAVVGVQRTFDAGLEWPAAIIMGTITAVGGGVGRDLLLRRVPAVFGGNALYASVAVAASVVMVAASALGSPTIGIVAAVVLSLLLRWGAVRWGWGLPNGREWQPQSTLASLLRRGRGLRPDAVRLLRRPGRRQGTGSVHTDDDH